MTDGNTASLSRSTASKATRRQLLSTTAGGLAVVLAGCGGGNGADGNDTQSPSQTDTGSQSPTTESGTTAASTETTQTTTESVSVEQVTADFVDQLGAGAFATAVDLFSDTYAAGFSDTVPSSTPVSYPTNERALQRYWTALTGQHGEYKTLVDVTPDGDRTATGTIQCQIDNQVIRVRVNGDGEISDLAFPAEYSPPSYASQDAFTEREISFAAGGLTTDATLTMPSDTDSTVPGVVLVHGTGSEQTDRDYTVGPNKILRDLAWGLATQGIAVLRYSRAERIRSTATADSDIDTLIMDDAVAAGQRLADTEAVQSDGVFVAGHSRGGIVTPRIAETHGELAGAVLLDAHSFPIEEWVPMAAGELADADWTTDGEQNVYEQQAQAFAALPERDFTDGDTVLGKPGAYYNSLLEYDQLATAQRITTPLFVMQTGRGTPMSYQQSFDRWRETLADDRTRTEFYTDQNHYFHTGSRPSVPIEVLAFHDNTAEPSIRDMVAWIQETVS